MLEGAEGINCLVRDTDSPDGSPFNDGCTRWADAALVGKRANAALHALWQCGPLKLYPSRYINITT